MFFTGKEVAMSVTTASNVASYIIDKCVRENEPVSNLQLQKILFFVQERYCEVTGSFLFDDDFEAWMYGPVIPSVYRTYSIWGGRKINWKFNAGASIPGYAADVIDPVIVSKRSIPPWKLVDQTHTPDSAWYEIYQGGCGDGDVIPKTMICGKCRPS